jgi:hypothetical protein
MWDCNIGTLGLYPIFLLAAILFQTLKVLVGKLLGPSLDSTSLVSWFPFQNPHSPKSLPLRSAGGSEAMGREDQIEEREVLDSIFPDEIIG